MRAGNHPRARKGREHGPGRRERGHHCGHQDPHARRAYGDGGTSAPPPPADAARPPGAHASNTRRRSTNRAPYRSHRHRPTSHRKPNRGWRAHLHGETGLHPQREQLGTLLRSRPPRPHLQAMTPATARATSQAPEEEEGTAKAPRARDRDTQRTRDHGTGPQGGQPHGHLPDRTDRAAHPDPQSTDPARHPHLTAPPRHQPATLRPALPDTTGARLTSTTAQHEAAQHTAPQRTTVQHNTTRHPKAQHATARRDTTRHRAAHHGTARRNTVGPSRADRNTARTNKPQHVRTRHHTARRFTAHHNTKQGTLTEGPTKSSHRTPRKEPHQPVTHRQRATVRPATTVVVHPHKPPPESYNRHRGHKKTWLTQGHT